MDINDVKAKIFFYAREQLFHTMLNTCKEAINKFANDVTIHLYHALALSANGRFQEGIRELEVLKLENDIQLAVCVALMYANKLMGNSDKDLYTKLDAQMRDCRKIAVSIDFYNTAYVLFIFKKYEKALEYVEKALNLDASNSEFMGLKGWIKLYLKSQGSKKSEHFCETFQKAVENNQRNLDASLGLAQAYIIENNTDEAINAVNKAVVRFSNSNLPLLQKVKLHFISQDYEQALESIARIDSVDSSNITAIKTNILILLCNKSNYEEAGQLIARLFLEMEKKEPRNGILFMETCQLFSRVCSRNKFVLIESYKFIEKALHIFPDNTDFITELGYQNYFQGKYKEALKYYKSATKINESSIKALMGMTLCELCENGKSETIKQQVEFLLELQENIPALLSFMQAKISENFDQVVPLLKQTCDTQLKLVKNLSYSEEYLRVLDVDFLLEIVKECLVYAPQSMDLTKKTLQKQSPVLDLALRVLKIITKACPGLKDALFLLAKVQFLRNDLTYASESLNSILSNIDETSSEAHVLLAQIQMSNGMYERAALSLEAALSHNFKVRENPLYHLITGLVEKKRNNSNESIKSLTTALSLIDLRPRETIQKKSSFDSQNELTIADKATIYLELIDSHKKLNQVHDANKRLQEAIEEFQGTPEEARIMILSADYAVSRRNVQHAIDMLSKVRPDESYYLEAKTKLAQIYLKERLDKRAYLQCYQEMVETNPGPDSYVLLGDAYLYILEPDLALESYEKALKLNPKDPVLTSKMGSALVETHHFARAVNYYKDTIKTTDDPELKLQLADLYMQLKQYDKAEQLLTQEVGSEKDKKIEDLVSLRYRTKLYMLLSQIYEKSGKMSLALAILKEGRDNQNRVRKLSSLEQSGISQEVINTSVDISMGLADLCINSREHEQAINHFKDALFISPDNHKTLAALAKLYIQMNYLDLCQQTCTNLLNIDPENEAASVMMADIAFRKIDFDMALFHFTQLLSKQPINWTALVRLVEIMRRTGNIENVSQYLQQAEEHCSKKEPGFCYATGLYEWYSGNLNTALRNFNNARQDPEWGKPAIYNMIEICLNPDDEMLNEQLMDGDDTEYRDSRSMAIKTAERLLKELKQKSNMTMEEMLKYRVLGNFLLLATKDKHNIENALEDFISIASTDMYKDNVGPVLGIATAYTMLKQGQRAKNQLKRVVKSIWTFEDAEYLERCWLLLADYYIQSSKFDLASDLLKRVLQHNKACSKAYEYSGFICEKEQHYNEAAKNYENSWKYSGRNNGAIGFKLAYNLMKCKKFADAIEICHQVLKVHPDYPRIKKDILDKCMNNLRT